MLKKAPLILPLLISASLAEDRIILLDSTIQRGTIVKQSEDLVIITTESAPGSGIYTDREIPRAKIKKIESQDDEAEAFDELKRLEPPETSTDTVPYDELVREKITPFLIKYPEGRFTAQITELRDQLLAERERIAAGETKVAGTWMTREQLENDPEAKGLLGLSNMRLAGNAIQTMVAFEIFEKNYASTSSFPAAVELAKRKVTETSGEISRAKAELDRKLREREQGLQLAGADSREIMERGIMEEDNAVKATVERARQTRQRWLPLLPDAKLLDDLSKIAQTEQIRLAKIDTTKLTAAIESARTAKEQLEAGDLEGAKASLGEANRLWPRYGALAPLKDSLKKAQDEAARRAKEEAKTSGS